MNAAQSFFSDIDRRLKGPQSMHLCGAAALVLTYGAPRAGSSIEVLPGEAPLWAQAGSDLANKHGLCLRASGFATFPPDWKNRCAPALAWRLTRLTLRAPAKEDLLLSKIQSLSDQDRLDIAFLAGIGVDPLELIRRFRALRRQHKGDLRILDRSFNYVLKENFSLGPFRF